MHPHSLILFFNSFIHSFIHSFVTWLLTINYFIYLFIQTFRIQSPIYSFICSFIHSFIHSFILSFILPGRWQSLVLEVSHRFQCRILSLFWRCTGWITWHMLFPRRSDDRNHILDCTQSSLFKVWSFFFPLFIYSNSEIKVLIKKESISFHF